MISRYNPDRPDAGEMTSPAWSSAFIMKCVQLASLALMLISCQGDNTQTLWQDEARVAMGSMEVTGGQSDSNLVMYIINEAGEKIKVENFTRTGSSFSFVMENSYFLSPPYVTRADKIVSMGNDKIFPSVEEGEIYRLRILIVQEDFENPELETQIIHKMIPVSRNDVLISTREINFADTMTTEPTGFQKVIVKNEKGEPVPDASLIGFMLGQGTNEKNEVIKNWLQDRLRPVIHKTDPSGTGYIYPLDVSYEKSSYVLIAWAKGYCTWVSAPKLVKFDPETKDKFQNVVLKECPDAGDETKGLVISYGPETLLYEEEIEDLNRTEKVGHFNSISYSLRIDSMTPFIRPLILRFRESFDPKGSKNEDVKDLEMAENLNYVFPFRSDLGLLLPNKFSQTDNGDGSFNITAVTKYDSKEFTASLLGRKKTTHPGPGFLSDLKVSGVDTHAMIPGSGTFYLQSVSCGKNMELGIKFAAPEFYFAPCHENKAQFHSSGMKVPGREIEIGSFIKARFFIKDKYKNISKDDLLNENELEIFVDYSAPDLEKYPLSIGSDIGFVSTGSVYTGPGFPSVEEPQQISRSSPGQWSLRFSSPDSCKTRGGDKGDGVLYGDQGIRFSRFAVLAKEPVLPQKPKTEESGPEEEPSEGIPTGSQESTDTASESESTDNSEKSPDDSQKDQDTSSGSAGSGDQKKEQEGTAPQPDPYSQITFTKCQSDDQPVEMQLTQESINFPSQASEEAKFFLIVRDEAGNYSKPHSFGIPSCQNENLPRGTRWCWSP